MFPQRVTSLERNSHGEAVAVPVVPAVGTNPVHPSTPAVISRQELHKLILEHNSPQTPGNVQPQSVLDSPPVLEDTVTSFVADASAAPPSLAPAVTVISLLRLHRNLPVPEETRIPWNGINVVSPLGFEWATDTSTVLKPRPAPIRPDKRALVGVELTPYWEYCLMLHDNLLILG